MPYIITEVKPNDDNEEYAVYNNGATNAIVFTKYEECLETLNELKDIYPEVQYKLYSIREL
jgi:hypothetical protein